VSIPPIILNGAPTCPQGYALSPDGSLCIPITPPISVDVTGVAAQEIDYSQQARQSARGYSDSGLIERAVTAWASSGWNLIKGLFTLAADVYDTFLSVLANFFLFAQGQRTEGYYLLVAALVTDLTGIAVDGAKMFRDFQTKGRLASMTDIGASLFNALASESAGQPQADSGSAWKITPGTGVGGLPQHDFTAGDGVKAAQAMLGFATSFAIREGNTDALASFLNIKGWNLGETFKDFAEDFSKGIGLSRLLRVAIRPLFQVMVALPLQYDLHQQYRPTLLGISDAIRAWKVGRFDDAQLSSELALHGLSDARITALKAEKSKPIPLREQRTLLAAATKPNAAVATTVDTIASSLAVEEFDKQTVLGWNIALDLDPARRLSLTYVEHYVFQFLTGHITFEAIKTFLDQAQAASGVLLTAGEFDGLRSMVDSVNVNPVLRIRHLPLATLQLAYIDGTITLAELDTHLQQLGYSDSDITILTLETLFKSKEKAAAAAAKAAKSKTGTSTPGSALPGIGGAPLP
jgi:hypothetical protein